MMKETLGTKKLLRMILGKKWDGEWWVYDGMVNGGCMMV